jgi:CxxC-x17-CxxC domain-containing protein
MNELKYESPDRILTCCDCGIPFCFSTCEQLPFQARQLRFPKRCPACRSKRNPIKLAQQTLRDGDRLLKCIDCNVAFVFSADEQRFFDRQGFKNDPKRCPVCRAQRNPDQRAQRNQTEIVCGRCGKPAIVPFALTRGTPAYCRNCFDATRPSAPRGNSDGRNAAEEQNMDTPDKGA